MTTQNAMPITVPVIVPNTLRDAAIQGDWPAWAQAWQQIDSTKCAALLQAIDMKADMKTGSKSSATLTLCGERSAQTYEAWSNGQNRLKTRFSRIIKGYFGTQPPSTVLKQL